MTVPDQSMTIEEILRRFHTGAPIGGIAREDSYGLEPDDPNEDFTPDFANMDLVDKTELAHQLAAEYRALMVKYQKKASGDSGRPKEAGNEPVIAPKT